MALATLPVIKVPGIDPAVSVPMFDILLVTKLGRIPVTLGAGIDVIALALPTNPVAVI